MPRNETHDLTAPDGTQVTVTNKARAEQLLARGYSGGHTKPNAPPTRAPGSRSKPPTEGDGDTANKPVGDGGA